MATPDQHKPKSNITGLIIACAVIVLTGLGAGIGARALFSEPEKPNKTASANETGLQGTNAVPNTTSRESPEEHPVAEPSNGTEGVGEDSELLIEDLAPETMIDVVVTPFEPVITNIANPKSVWIRLEGAIVIRQESAVGKDILAARASQEIVAYLRTIELEHIEGTNGLLFVTEDLNEAMRTFSGGDVRQVLISGFIVE